jgi:hypothetical protein
MADEATGKEIVSFYRQATSGSAGIPASFLRPREADFFLRAKIPSVQSMQLSYPVRSIFQDRFSGLVVRALLAVIGLMTAATLHAAPPAKLPDFDTVASEVQRYFQSQPDYQSGDLIRRSQIEAVLKNVAAAGWKVNNPKQIMELGLPDNSFLVRELSTPAGKKFMRKVATRTGGYSHLDRLSTIPRGERTIRDLIRDPNGDDLITYLATTTGGRNMGKMMGGVRGGVDLNKPTGRIYTANDLVAVLKKLHVESTP